MAATRLQRHVRRRVIPPLGLAPAAHLAVPHRHPQARRAPGISLSGQAFPRLDPVRRDGVGLAGHRGVDGADRVREVELGGGGAPCAAVRRLSYASVTPL